jgi:DNA-directed RNA polymerase specialized sigma24 family protein
MPALAKRIEIGAEDRVELEQIVRSSTAEMQMAERAQIALEAGEGHPAAEIGRLLGCSTNTTQK